MGAIVEDVEIPSIFKEKGIECFYTFWLAGLANIVKNHSEEEIKKLEP